MKLSLQSLKERTKLVATGKNIVWLLMDVFIKKLLGLIVGVQVAKYLGDADLGIYNYGFIYISFFAVIASLGIDQIIVRDLASKKYEEGKILGTSFALKLTGSIITSAIAIILAVSQRGTISLQTIGIIITAVGYIFNAFNIFEDWFHSRVLAKFNVISRSIAAIIIAALKLLAVFNHLSVVVFIILGVAEAVIGWTLLIPFYLSLGNSFKKWSVDITYLKYILRKGFPLLIIAFLGMIGARVDQLLLGAMASRSLFGQYSVAVMIGEVALILSGAISSSTFPTIALAKQQSKEEYEYKLQLFATAMMWGGILSTAIISIFAPTIIHVIFGEKFALAGSILRIYVLSNFPIFLSAIWTNWLIIEDNQKKIFIFTLINAVTNALGNFIVIPLFGVFGAAWMNFASIAFSITFSIIITNNREIYHILLGALIGKGIILPVGKKQSLISEVLH